MATKRKRGPNYTSQEIALLLNLIEQHRSVLEDKCLNGPTLKRKKDAWTKICADYNSVASSGSRTMEQLKTFYDNRNFRLRKQNTGNGQASKDFSSNESQNEVYKELKESENEISFTLTNRDLKLITTIQQQISQLSNSGDNYTTYYEDTASNESVETDVKQFTITEDITHKDNDPLDSDHCYAGSSIEDNNEDDDDNRREIDNVQISPKKGEPMKNKSAEYYKQLYFMRKSQNAALERKKISQDMQYRQIEHNLLLKEHQLRLSLMVKQHKIKMYSLLKD